jgi:hypothetical protein
MERLRTPVLLIIYKRVETTRQVLEKIREIKPLKLYISANGHNPLAPADLPKCVETRNIVNEIDWPCVVITNFRDHHLSAKESITGGITWFFSHEPEGIILEDDCVVDPSFFWLCQELLEKYRDQPNILHIGASNFQDGIKRGEGSYYFSRYNHIWGWAGWRKSWEGYDVNFCKRPLKDFIPVLKNIFDRGDVRGFWKQIYLYIRSGRVDTWDTQYMFHLWKRNGMAITPNVNMVKNIGFGKDATNTHSPYSKWASLEVESVKEIKHPVHRVVDKEADNFTADQFYRISWSARTFHLKIMLSRFIPLSLKRKLRGFIGLL